MPEPFGIYVTDEQHRALRTALAEKGYRISIREHGGRGGGTEWVVRRWTTRHHVLLGWFLPIAALLAAPLFIKGAGVIALLPLGLTVIALVGFPAFSASFMRPDSPSETEWTCTEWNSDDELEHVIAIFEEASGRKVRRVAP